MKPQLDTAGHRSAFFGTRDRQALLVLQAMDWEGTPFHAHAALKGVGVDCVWLAAKIYIACGVIDHFDPPGYTMDGGQHNDLSLVTAWLDRCRAFIRADAGLQKPECDVQVGDLLCFRMGRCVHHVGILITDYTFVHVYQGYQVMQSRIDDPTWRKRLAAVYRPIQHPATSIQHPTTAPLQID